MLKRPGSESATTRPRPRRPKARPTTPLNQPVPKARSDAADSRSARKACRSFPMSHPQTVDPLGLYFSAIGARQPSEGRASIDTKKRFPETIETGKGHRTRSIPEE